jgi:hypothetical protein
MRWFRRPFSASLLVAACVHAACLVDLRIRVAARKAGWLAPDSVGSAHVRVSDGLRALSAAPGVAPPAPIAGPGTTASATAAPAAPTPAADPLVAGAFVRLLATLGVDACTGDGLLLRWLQWAANGTLSGHLGSRFAALAPTASSSATARRTSAIVGVRRRLVMSPMYDKRTCGG